MTNTIFEKTEQSLKTEGFNIVGKDFDRPWGGFLVIDEIQAALFVDKFFPGYEATDLIAGRKVSPKILLVAPEQRLSWQYHHRRSEVWRVVEGPVGIVQSATDEEQPLKTFDANEMIVLAKGERHRLVGLNNWGKIAEIWQHTNPDHPSDESDIIRLQDDYGRKSG